ncbi:adenylate/guanylate cyclase domain-containing protein [Curvibacter sp. APW13]|uniref:adenylate/guanylate cyclase domain-containing protein n=1 Tax=Curvibacter sp. APW13 TaxID=3077236 RepID=UPI0028DF7EFD|nr:adenylate/guanylate cyclase domain-containing protein [Curvibacter sp. APW13]MDT8991643.1 adenylate/guanylate cyclase domain-containing protein [Curvibacter sp. APW13]
MPRNQTVVFTDLHGSTAVFESLGNARATEVVTGFNTEIGRIVQAHRGQVVKTLGDGLLAIFDDALQAIEAAVTIQRDHQQRLSALSDTHRMPVRIGISSGDVEWVQGDCYGDAVNVASRLCDLCGPNQIWINLSTLDAVNGKLSYGCRTLGTIAVRGRVEPCSVFQVEWQSEAATELMTVLGQFDPDQMQSAGDSIGKEIELHWNGHQETFHAFDLPVSIGRVKTNRLVVPDPRVSRTHAQLLWKNGAIVLEDLSSYGTWIRFSDAPSRADILLRRSSSVLYGQGILVLGATFSDSDAPVVRFKVS